MGNTMNINLKVWRQENENASVKFFDVINTISYPFAFSNKEL